MDSKLNSELKRTNQKSFAPIKSFISSCPLHVRYPRYGII